MEFVFTSLVRTECGIFVMYCLQLFCSAWMCCLEEIYMFAIVMCLVLLLCTLAIGSLCREY